jgi:hypothetical protein
MSIFKRIFKNKSYIEFTESDVNNEIDPNFEKDFIKELYTILTEFSNIPQKYMGYYAGGTLCIDHKIYGTLFLNFNKHIIISFSGVNYNVKLPVYVRQKLFEIYLMAKGKTEFYNEEYTKYLRQTRKEKIENLL